MAEMNSRKNKKKESKRSLFRRFSSLSLSFSSKRRRNSSRHAGAPAAAPAGGEKKNDVIYRDFTVTPSPLVMPAAVIQGGEEEEVSPQTFEMTPKSVVIPPIVATEDQINEVLQQEEARVINPIDQRDNSDIHSEHSNTSNVSGRNNIISDDEKSLASTEVYHSLYHRSSRDRARCRQYEIITDDLHMNNTSQSEETINNGRKEKGVEDAMESSFRLDGQVSATPMEQEQDDGMLKNSERASQKSEDFHTCHESFDVSTSYSDTVLTHERNSASVKNRDWEDFDRRIVGDGVWWEPGSRISIIGGKYEGRNGTCLGVTASKKSMIVNVDGHGEKRLLMKSVGPFVGSKSPEMYRSSIPVGDASNNRTWNEFSFGDKPKQNETGRDDDKSATDSINHVHDTQRPLIHASHLDRHQPNESLPWWEPGSCISIIGGKYKGRHGTYLGVTASKKSMIVNVDGHGEKRLLMKSVGPFVGNKSPEMYRSSIPVGDANGNRTASEFSVGDHVWICGGKYRGRIGIIHQVCPKTYKVSMGDTVGTIMHKYVKSEQSIPEYEKENDDFRMPDYNSGGMKFGDDVVTKILVSTNRDYLRNSSFISHLAGQRLLTLQRRLNSDQPIQETIIDSSGRYELISKKIVKSDDGGFFKPKEYRCEYIQTEGPGLTKVSLSDMLSSLANFAALPTRKVAARLDLLFSPVYKCKVTGQYLLKTFHHSSFEEIKEDGHVGCGFICEELLCDLLGNNTMAERAICIQIRAIIPSKGIFKGMLMRKRITSGSRIQFPSSMKKVPASTSETISESGCLVVTQAGVDPSPANVNTGKLPTISRNGELLPDSFCPKELSKMLSRLFKALKVPDHIIREYTKISTRKKGEKRCPLTNHSFLRGVADPTGAIPPNTVFLTGVQNASALNDFIFITRSPCIKADDGRLVKVLREKPESMSIEDFDWLNSLSFGVVIFGFPKEGFISIPEQIADGDLDGDRYFCCWDRSILEYIEAEIVTDIPSPEEVSEKARGESCKKDMERDWFRAVQQFMISSRTDENHQLISCLFKLSNEAADNDKENFMRNKDAEAFADAYKKAVDNGKHGTNVILPRHLWDKVPLKLRKYLTEA